MVLCARPAGAVDIVADYRYDTAQFFSAAGNPQGAAGAALARATVEAAAARWSAIIDQPLGAVALVDDNDDPRIRVSHPGTGAAWQISSANSIATDSLVQEGGRAAANEYRGAWSIPADTWILHAGAHDISPSAGFGGTEIGTNWTSILNDPDGVNHRGFTTPSAGARSLPVWGGWFTINNSSTINWNLDHTRAPAFGQTDLYSIALHEIGHALGLNTGFWNEWETQINGGFVGAGAVAAYNADNSTQVTSLALDATEHWVDGRYKSFIFPAGSPNYVGTVGAGVLQELLLDARLPDGMRFEITNVDVGALSDLGWSVISGDVVTPAAATNLRVEVATDGSVVMSWTSVVGSSYTVQRGADLANWTDVTSITANSTSTTWRDTQPSAGGLQYYRVVTN